MFMKRFKPNYEFSSVQGIDETVFKGKKLIIFDIDNTLFHPETTKIDSAVMKWFRKINKKYTCVCFSNSKTIDKRATFIEKKLGCTLYKSSLRKPSKKLFKEIVSKYKVVPSKVVVIGDLHLADMWFGNRNGATTIFVHPFSKEEKLKVKFARLLASFIR